MPNSNPDIDLFWQNAVKCYHRGQLDQAGKICEKILACEPESPEALNLLGLIAENQGDPDKAITLITRAVRISPRQSRYYRNLGNAYQGKAMHPQAAACFRRIIKLEPGNTEAYFKLGVIENESGNKETALDCYRRALELKPDRPDILFNLALVHEDLGERKAAIDCYQRVLEIAPDSAETLYNLACLLAQEDRFDEAVRLLQKSVEINSTNADAYNNLGLNLKALGKIDEAISQFRKAIEIDPDLAHGHLNLALALLLIGEYAEGWREYDWRFEVGAYRADYRYRNRKMWDGKSFKDRCLLVHDDQGLGDAIQFVRYLPLVKKLGGTVILEIRREILPLLAEFAGIDTLLERPSDGLSDVQFDYYIPLLSIPGRLGTRSDSIPENIPYLFGDADKCAVWKEKTKSPGIKIGINWAGNKSHVNDRNRSCSLDHFNWLQDISSISLFSLQIPVSPAEETQLNKLGALNFGPQFNDFSDTAAVIENLDLVISVDTAVAHMAGAMGKPIWILLPFDPDWRWMLTGSQSPWYPTARLFRQSQPGDWDGVMSAVCRALKGQVQR